MLILVMMLILMLILIIVSLFCVILLLLLVFLPAISGTSDMVKSRNMAYRGGEFRFFQVIHLRIGIRIDIFISIRPMTTKFGKHVHPQDLTKMSLIKQSWCHYVKTT